MVGIKIMLANACKPFMIPYLYCTAGAEAATHGSGIEYKYYMIINYGMVGISLGIKVLIH